MESYKTKQEALEKAAIGDFFLIDDRKDAVFSIFSIKKNNSDVSFIARVFGSKIILELNDALVLADSCNLHVKKVETTHIFVDGVYMHQKDKKGDGKRIISTAEVVDIDTGLSYIRTGSAGIDNVAPNMKMYTNEISNKRAIVRTILAALKMHDVYVDIEFSEDVDNIIKERAAIASSKFIESNNNENKNTLITETQITAINNLLKSSTVKLSKILTGYNVKSLKELSYEQGKVVINELRKRSGK